MMLIEITVMIPSEQYWIYKYNFNPNMNLFIPLYNELILFL